MTTTDQIENPVTGQRIVVRQNLVTGQNPRSSKAVAPTVVELLGHGKPR